MISCVIAELIIGCIAIVKRSVSRCRSFCVVGDNQAAKRRVSVCQLINGLDGHLDVSLFLCLAFADKERALFLFPYRSPCGIRYSLFVMVSIHVASCQFVYLAHLLLIFMDMLCLRLQINTPICLCIFSHRLISIAAFSSQT